MQCNENFWSLQDQELCATFSFVLALFMEFSDLWPIDEFMWEFLFYVFACRGSEVDDLVLEDSKLVFVVAILFMHTHVICFRCICLLL